MEVDVPEEMELCIEIEPINPDTPKSVSSLIKEAFDESIIASGLDQIPSQKPEMVFKQHLPLIAEMNLVVSVIQLAITADPLLISKVKLFLSSFFSNQKFKKAVPKNMNIKFSIGNEKFEAKDLSSDGSFKIKTKGFEFHYEGEKG